jgi:hypothetical protein
MAIKVTVVIMAKEVAQLEEAARASGISFKEATERALEIGIPLFSERVKQYKKYFSADADRVAEVEEEGCPT